jgi:hypothetical protein
VRCLFPRFLGFSNDNFGSRGRLRRPEIVLQEKQTSVINTVYHRLKTKSLKFIAGVNDTAEKLFIGVNDIADKFFGGVSDTGD